MIELGQLERRHEDFARRNVRVIVASLDKQDDARQTQERFPHLLVLSDAGHGLTDAAQVLHPHAAPDGGDADAPTTFLVDRHGTVRWFYRPAMVSSRLSPDEVLQAIDRYMPGKPE
ncbi:MAG TPA: redoxin domain-containing protein [Gemmataceae bacterium]|nr:redoxin domain-containing protein [Gemmataceae bacterium]